MAVAPRTFAETGPSWRVSLANQLANGWGLAIALTLGLRLIYSLFALIVSQFAELAPACAGGKLAPILQASGSPLGVWQRWDTCWFESIAAGGYRADPASVGFLPLYPLLMRLISPLFLNNFTLSGLVVSVFACTAALAGLYQLVRDDFDASVARRTVLYVALFPSAFYLLVPYAESVLLACIVWAFVFARRGQWWQAAAVAGLAGITRSPGILLCLPLAWEAWRQWRVGRARIFAGLAAGAPIATFAAFNEYCKAFVGWSYLVGTNANWGGELIAPWLGLLNSWHFVRATGHPIEALNLALLALSLILIVAGSRRLPLAYTIFALAQWLLISGRSQVLTPLMGSNRYLLMAFPLFIVLALTFQHPLVHRLWLVASTLLLAALLTLYLLNTFVA